MTEQYRPYKYLDNGTAMKQLRRQRLMITAYATVISFAALALLYCSFYAGTMWRTCP